MPGGVLLEIAMFKNQLQELAQRSCFNLPAYTCMREGPDHALRFKATVNFNGEVFESPNFCGTLRQAEQTAAEVALNTLSKRGPSHSLAGKLLDETGVCKNLLQETSQRAGVQLPVYTTTRSGPAHMPLFSCAVEVAGLSFTGDAAKTKKQAEKNAAMAAWSALKQLAKQDGAPWAPPFESEVEDQEPNIVARAMMRAHGKDDCMILEALSQQPMPLLQWPAQGRTQEPVGTPSNTKLIADGVRSNQQLLGPPRYYNCAGSSHDLPQSQWSMFSGHQSDPGVADHDKVVCGGKVKSVHGSKLSEELLATGSYSGKASLTEVPESSKTKCREVAEVLIPLSAEYKLDELEWLAGEGFQADGSTMKHGAHESNGAATTITMQPLENPMVWSRSSTHCWNGKLPESTSEVSGGNFYAGAFHAPPVRVRSVVAVCAAPTRPIIEEIEDTDEQINDQTRQMLDRLSL